MSAPTWAASSSRIRITSDLVVVAAVLVLPAACIWLTPTMLTVAGYVDPFFYTGYMVNLKSLVSHFGITYYLMRLAVILPGKWTYGLFGAEHGFFVLEYFKMLVGCLSIFLIARRFYGLWVASFCAVFLCFLPWYVRANTWDYVDGFAINYILAGLAFVLVPRGLPLVSLALGGFCCALATNSNLFALAIWSSFVPPWLIIHGFRPWDRFVKRAVSFFAGFIAAYCGLTIYANKVLPGTGPFIERISISYAQDLLSGGSHWWYQPVSRFFWAGNYYIVVPFVIALGAAIVVRRSQRYLRENGRPRLTAAFMLYLLVIITVYVVNQEVFHSPRITESYYFSYSVIPCVLVLMAMIGQFEETSPGVTHFALAGVTIAIPVLWKLLEFDSRYATISYVVFVLPLFLFVIGSAAEVRYASTASVCIIVSLLAISPFFLRSSADYGSLLEHVPYEMDVYAGAINLANAVERVAPLDSGPIRFWYATQPGGHWLLGSITSIYLGSRLWGSEPPTVTEKLRENIAQTSTVVVLGLTAAEVDRSVASLHQARIATRTLAASIYRGQAWSYAYAVLHPLP
jgi:hypothetical protein